MPAVVVIGLQWGDEGKGKIVDFLSREAQLVVRHQGGNNAGHTVHAGEEKYVLHLVPSGILYPDTLCIIANGVVVNPEVLLEEIADLQGKSIPVSPENLLVSPNAHLIMPYHVALDRAADAKQNIGTTGRGIGPAYMDKVGRKGITVGDLVYDEAAREKIIAAIQERNRILAAIYGVPELNPEEAADKYLIMAKELKPYVGEVNAMLRRAASLGKRILFEGAQGSMLDPDWGTYPYVTSSSTLATGAYVGAGFPASEVGEVLGVAKAYTTRVGSGPFPSEMAEKEADIVRNAGPIGEYGATTGRPRRCGWLDLALLRRSVAISGVTSIAITRLDILSGMKSIPVCVGYEYEGKRWDSPPEWHGAWSRMKPIFEEKKSWKEDLSEVRVFEDLPAAAMDYVRMIEETLEVPVGLVSVGPGRTQTIVRRQSFFR